MRELLPHYVAVRDGKEEPRFWSADLEKRASEAFKLLESCELCEHRCGVNRTAGEKGVCKAPPFLYISSEFLHYGEENFLVPSHTIFFMGCNLSCVYCQNYTISNWLEFGTRVSEEALAEIIARRKEQHAMNVNFVGGEPTPYLPFILKVLQVMKEKSVHTPVVWNSNFYMSEKAMSLLKGVVDLYLPDFKYGNDECALRLSKVKNYFATVTRNLKEAAEDADVCIRHLVLPNHFECCTKPVLEWIAENINGRNVVVNVMAQYRPEWKAHEYEDISRPLKLEEGEKAVSYAEDLGLNVVD